MQAGAQGSSGGQPATIDDPAGMVIVPSGLLRAMVRKKDDDDWEQPPTKGFDWFPWKKPVVNA